MANVNPVLDFFASLTRPNCEQMHGPNKTCKKIRIKQQIDEEYLVDDSLEVLVVTFEGVIGAFMPTTPQSRLS